MTSKRVKIRPLVGGVNKEKKNDLSGIIHEKLKIKYSRIMEAGDSFVVVCLDELNVDLLISANSIATLKRQHYEVVLPPHLRARKCVICRNLDSDLHNWSEERLHEDLENRNEWAKIEQVTKLKNIPHMIKIRFSEIAMANKACDAGLALHSTHLGTNQIEHEDFIPITPCWHCYKYDHSSTDCPLQNIKHCSECAAVGHTFRECNNRENPKCLNCEGNHRTLAAICPIRKALIKEKREEKKQSKKTFAEQNRTYCAVAKLSTEIPKAIKSQKPEQTVLQITNTMSQTIVVIIVEAHLHNMINPGTFNQRVNQLLHLNNLPQVNMPDNAPSSELFNIITQLPEYAQEDNQEEEMPSDDSNTEVEIAHSATTDETTTSHQTDAAVTTPRRAPQTQPAQPQRQQQQQHRQQQKQRQQTQQQQEIAVRPKEQRQRTQKPEPLAPPPSPERQTRQRQDHDLGLKFYTYKNSGVLETMAPDPLYRTIREGKVKYTYLLDLVSEADIINYIKDGTLNTEQNKIRSVENPVFKKIRNGLQKGSPPEATARQKLRFTSP